jgi:dimethylglycine dehydrogenase
MATRVGKILAFAYLKPEAAEPGTALEVVIHGSPAGARAGRTGL